MKRRRFLAGASGAVAAVALGRRYAFAYPKDETRGVDPKEGDFATVWPSASHLFRANLLAGPGFSFRQHGTKAIANSVERGTDAGTDYAKFRYESGIEVTRSAVELPAENAVEYTLKLRNGGNQPSAPVHDVNALDIAFATSTISNSYVLSSGGGIVDGTYPPEAFAIRKHLFDPTLPSWGGVTLTTEGGRSSNRDLPFFLIHNDEARSGVFVAIGWTGQWKSEIFAVYSSDGDDSSSGLILQGGIPDIHLALDPGEEISGPRILIGSYQGTLQDGSNKLRRIIRTHYTPKIGTADFGVIATYDSWWNIVEHYDEALLRPIAVAAAALGQEYFLLDAAWYVGSDTREGFSGGVGNWETVDEKKFPQGLESFADYVRLQNLKFGLWFEPERVHRNSALAKQNPDWILWGDPAWESNYGLLDYGRPEVRQWVQKMMDHYIRSCQIKYIRHDFNIDPLPYWNEGEMSNRRGLRQIRHIEGFYSVIDWIREHHPDTVLECCASGGRRIDLETARRFHTQWISDDTIDPVVDRFHLQGINHFLPASYAYVQYTLPTPDQKDFHPKDIDHLSLFAGGMGLGGRIDLWSEEQKRRFRRIEEVHKKLRPFLMEDYYLLIHQPSDLKDWSGWQFHNPSTDSGFAQVFRDNSADEARPVSLRGLTPQKSYRFWDPLGDRSFTMTGQEAMNGIKFALPTMSSQILAYETKT